MTSHAPAEKLAIDGGRPVREAAWPARGLFGPAEREAVRAVLDRAIEAGEMPPYHGEEEEAYCREFAELLGGGFADGVNSGTNAVYVALRALEIEPFTEVIVPPITDPGGVMPVALMNCIPVPADAAVGSFNTSAEQIAARMTERTSAVIVAHIAGLPVDMDPVMALARSRGVPVLEDCAQAHGARYKGRPVGTIGDVAAFSTMSGKHHASGGQGGLVFTRSEETYWRVRRAADRGKPFALAGATSNVTASLNCNMDEIHAAIGRVQLRKLPEIARRRRAQALELAERCRQSLATVRVVEELPGCEGSYWFVMLRFEPERFQVDKGRFVAALAAEGLPAEADYLAAPSLADWYRNRSVFGRSGYPWACPLYRGDADSVCDVPNAIEANARRFRMAFHENCGPAELRDTVDALRKVEAAYVT